jgi:hypothetical protein
MKLPAHPESNDTNPDDESATNRSRATWLDTIPVRRRLWVLAASALAVLLLAACGGGDDSDGVASVGGGESSGAGDSSADETSVTEEELLAYTECLREQGIEIGDPVVDEDGNVSFGEVNHADPEFMENIGSAMDACGEPPGGMRREQADATELEDTLLEYAQCMRDNGYEDFPDPDVSAAMDDPDSGGPFGDIDEESPEFQAADEVCQDILAGIDSGAGSGAQG